MRGVEEKQVGFDSAAVAIITEDAPRETVKLEYHPSMNAPTGQLLYSLRILPPFAVPVLDDSNIRTEPLYELDDVLQPAHQRRLFLSHIPRPTVHGQRTDASPYDPFDELFCFLLRRQEANLCRHGNLRGKVAAQRCQDRAQEIRICEQGGTHA